MFERPLTKAFMLSYLKKILQTTCNDMSRVSYIFFKDIPDHVVVGNRCTAGNILGQSMASFLHKSTLNEILEIFRGISLGHVVNGQVAV